MKAKYFIVQQNKSTMCDQNVFLKMFMNRVASARAWQQCSSKLFWDNFLNASNKYDDNDSENLQQRYVLWFTLKVYYQLPS